MGKDIAAALRYDPSLPAPFVVARGRGDLASKLVDLAHRAGVPVRTEAELAERLLWLNPGEVIPEELYRPVAELLLFLLEIETSDYKKENDEKNSG